MADLLGHIAAQTGQLLNVAATAERVGTTRETTESHLRLLEDLFLAVRLPAWGKSLRSRVSAKPKVHVVDSGLAARLLRLTPEKVAGIDPTSLTDFGHLLETFVVGELCKQASWLDDPVTLGHWRTSDGAEVTSSSSTTMGESSRSRSKPANGPRGRSSAVLPSFATCWGRGSSAASC